MFKEDFSIALSEREGEEAIKEVSLKIKRLFPKDIHYLLLLFTPHYVPAQILKTVNFTLKPKKFFAIQAPWLIFEERFLQKGVVVCCINKEGLFSHEAFLEAEKSLQAESFLRSAFKNLRKKDYFFLSFLSPSINPSIYLNSLKLSLGELITLIGAGDMKKYASHNYQIINDTVNEGLINIALKGLEITTLKISGYVPLGKPFKITKAVSNRNLIIEINGQPAVNIYRHYAEEKYDEFMKRKFFSLYPLGIKKNGSVQLTNIIGYLQDGSLICTGEVKEGLKAQIMFLDTTSLFRDTEDKLASFKQKGQGLIFMINSLTRKGILKDLASEELRLIKRSLGNDSKIIGLCSDYALSVNQENGYIDVETGDVLLTLWD